VPSDELRLDEQDEGVGPNAVVGHRVGTGWNDKSPRVDGDSL
jgi:hypothetical protein